MIQHRFADIMEYGVKMYNRYMQSEFAEDSAPRIDYIPVIRHDECEQCEVREPEFEELSCQSAEDDIISAQKQDISEPAKPKEGFLSGLLNFKDFNLETVGVVILALFLMCDKPEDATNCILLLVLLIMLGF